MTRFNHLIVEWPKLVLLLAVLLTGLLGYEAWHLRIDSSADNLYSQNDPNKEFYDQMRALFGSDDMGVIGIVSENVYTPGTLAKIKRLTTEVAKVSGVESVQSLTNVPDPISDLGDPPLLIPQIPSDRATLDALRRKVEENPIYSERGLPRRKGCGHPDLLQAATRRRCGGTGA